ncbi:desmoglein-2.1-like [Pempheris klunzingeri]|uniref:desmoglein-2.1-like n=1 Tax=Pempheris klunzingeri TaxID=3127111 RepID=UPI0039801669
MLLKENKDYTKKEHIAKIHSDFDNGKGNIDYSLEGIGASQYPFHVFVVHPKTGFIRLTKVLDREEINEYNLSGVAKYHDGREAEKRIDIRIKVLDDNDNAPVFGVMEPAEVNELSPPGTFVKKITATDADEPGHVNSQIAYTIVDQNPRHDMFYITNDGSIHVKQNFLDRERADKYILTVKGQDLNGQPWGNSGTGTVTINVLDVNDNVPTLEKEELHAIAVVKAACFTPPVLLKENKDYTKKEHIAKIPSDFDNGKGNIDYFLEGIGASQYPFHVFVVHPTTGLIRLTKVLDREAINWYNLSGVVKYHDGREAQKRIDIRIKVLDENDNAPVFGVMEPAEVNELSPPGTFVKKITATDADEPGHVNSQIAYTIVDQNPRHDMFYITNDGSIHVKQNFLDREREDKYILTVKGQDLNGQPGGNSGTGTVTINVLDVNDNVPTLEKEEYEGSIEENTRGVEVMRIKAEDLDLKGTDNWEAVFDIVKGNEAGYFSITTDPKTNEGILMLDKEVDYKDVKDLKLGLAVRNKAPPFDGPGADTGAGGGVACGVGADSGSSGPKTKTYPIKINVKNKPEGPAFDPKVKAIPISEGGDSSTIKDFIAYYPAIDGDTGKTAENVWYAKGSDPYNWLTIDPNTAGIKLNKMPDRESPYLVNGTYIAKVLCITNDMPPETATGTIAIQVEDINDNCPTLTSSIKTMCTTADSVIVNAKDEDEFPNGPPFDFTIIPEGTEGKWQVEHLNDTAAILRAQEPIWPGFYKVEFMVKDKQGQACPQPQKVQVHVCTCEDGVVCGQRRPNGQPKKRAEFGPLGIGLLFLGLFLLLFILLLLLFRQCLPGGCAGLPGGFTEMPFDTKSHLINYRTEGQGENTEVNMPTQLDGDMFKVSMGMANNTSDMAPMAYMDFQKSVTSMNGAGYQGFSNCHKGMMNQPSGSGFFSEFESRESGIEGGLYDSMALPDHFLGQYYSQKVDSGNENLEGKDSLLVYDYEGQSSSAGSVGCCSLLDSDNDLQFLSDLGPKFKTLAEVCGGKKIPAEVKQVLTPQSSASISTQSSVSHLMTAQQLPPPPKLEPTVTKTEQTVVNETSKHSQVVKESMANVIERMTTVNEGMANQGQMLLLQQQQPVYYTTSPVLQPMHYVVQPQIQNTMLLTETPSANLHGMVLVNGTQMGPAQGVVVQGQTVMSSGQAQGPGMLLVEKTGVQEGGTNLIHTGNLAGSQTMLVVEGKVPAGSLKVLKGSQTCLVQGGTLSAGGLSGSQGVLMVGGSTSTGGQLVQESGGLSHKSDMSGSQRVLYSTSTGPQNSMVSSSTTTASTTPTYRKVVVQERKIH